MIKTRFITAFQSDTRTKHFKRLIFGVNLAAGQLQHPLQTIIADIPGKTNIVDDILIFTEDTKQYDETLTRVLERCDSKGITLNSEKSIFCKDNLKYYGFMLSKKGMKPDPQKIQEIRELPALENRKALQSFLGLTNYMKRFIHNYSTQTHHLRELLQEDKDYTWTETHEQNFNNLKQSLSSESCVSYFDSHRETFIYTDADSPHGISAILLQKTRNQENRKIVAYSSRALSSAQKNYSQLNANV